MENSQGNTPIPAVPISVPQVTFKRDEETFFSGYANSVIVESNIFDLKLIFGLYDHRDPTKPVVGQFSSVNIPWSEVKLLMFWMQVHLAGHEKDNGKVKVPTGALPPEPPTALPPQFDNPKGRESLEMLRKMRAEFIASLSEP
jgi:hypothetical protein